MDSEVLQSDKIFSLFVVTVSEPMHKPNNIMFICRVVLDLLDSILYPDWNITRLQNNIGSQIDIVLQKVNRKL